MSMNEVEAKVREPRQLQALIDEDTAEGFNCLILFPRRTTALPLQPGQGVREPFHLWFLWQKVSL